MEVGLVFNLAFRIIRFLPLYRIQFLKTIKMETKKKSAQNLVEDITNSFIWFANAIKNAAKARLMDSSKKLI